MSISGQTGEVAIALQPGKVGRRGTFLPSILDYYKMRAIQVGLGLIKTQQRHPQEVGALPVPSGVFVDGFMSGGSLTLTPRLKGDFGLLLTAALGEATTNVDQDAFGNAAVGVNAHKFTFKAGQGQAANIPWVSFRKMVPGVIDADNSGEVGFDNRIGGLRFAIPASGKLSTQIAFQGRDGRYENANLWTYANATYEAETTTPDSGRGNFYIGGVEYPVVAAEIVFSNGLTNPQQEKIVGDFRPDDFIALDRTAQIRISVKYEDAELCKTIITGSPDGSAFSDSPYYTLTAGQTKAFEATFRAPTLIPSTSTQYGLRIFAERVAWQMEGYPQLAGGNLVMVNFVGTVTLPDSGDYFAIWLENDNDGTMYVPGSLLTLGVAAAKSYTGTPVNDVLDAAATLTDLGWSSWDTGKVAVKWGTPTSGTFDENDSLDIDTSGSFTLAGSVLSHTATEIGTVYGGTYEENLIIKLNSNATTSIVQDLLRAIRYGRVGGSDVGASIPLTFIVMDGSKNAVSDTITVTHA